MLFKKYGMGELSKHTYYTDISGVPVMETIRNYLVPTMMKQA